MKKMTDVTPIIKSEELVIDEEKINDVLDKLIDNQLISSEYKDYLRTELLRHDDCFIILRLLNKSIDLKDYFDPGSRAEIRAISYSLLDLKSPITIDVPGEKD